MVSRPDPDELLKHIQPEERKVGRLKIFLGYASGVGKTYAMLEAAHQRREQGVDVVVGYVETHGRTETEDLLLGLEVLPPRQVEYRTIQLSEVDVDAVLARRPEIVLIDELAHTNAPGSRHPKRYLDVEEILAAGIGVYTTLNIQHLESLNDVVAQVTGISVRETIPDRVIDEAGEIEVIDLPPEELLTRLREGKVYIPEQAARAIEEFFRKGNLTALREMSLRRAAERVDDQMRAYMQTRAISGPWPAGERLLVCLSPSPLAEKLVRTARHLADQLKAAWIAVYVDVASRPELDALVRERIGAALQLAEELGARSETLTGQSIHEAVLAYARRQNVTKIVVGKPARPRWRDWLGGSLVDQLIRGGGEFDVYVVGAKAEVAKPRPRSHQHPRSAFGRYLLSLGLVGLSTLIGLSVRGHLEPANLVMLFLMVVVISAVYLGRGPSLLSAVAGVLAFDFLLVPPYLSFAIADTEYLLTFVGLFVVSLVISTLTTQVREQAEAAVRREIHISALYDLGRDLTSATDVRRVAEVVVRHIGHALERDVAIYVAEGGRIRMAGSSSGFVPEANDLAVATWTFEHGQVAGAGSDTLPAVPLLCQPLKTARGLVGVLGIRALDPRGFVPPEQRQALVGFAQQAALALERATLVEQAMRAELLQATERLQTALLNSISHDLRTPLVTITGALSALGDEGGALDESSRLSLIENALSEAHRLNRLVGNLLNMTRIEAGALRLSCEFCDVTDLVSSSIEAIEHRMPGHPIKEDIAPDLPLVRLDFALMVQVLVNLLENAIKYSPRDLPVEIEAFREGDRLILTVQDQGPGIPAEDRVRVFDKFYRVQRPGIVSGTGLGLSICKGIVEAHGGDIRAEEHPGGGAALRVSLPLA